MRVIRSTGSEFDVTINRITIHSRVASRRYPSFLKFCLLSGRLVFDNVLCVDAVLLLFRFSFYFYSLCILITWFVGAQFPTGHTAESTVIGEITSTWVLFNILGAGLVSKHSPSISMDTRIYKYKFIHTSSYFTVITYILENQSWQLKKYNIKLSLFYIGKEINSATLLISLVGPNLRRANYQQNIYLCVFPDPLLSLGNA